MQEFVAKISHHESKTLSGKFASSTNFMRLAKWFNDNFLSFPNGIEVSSRNAPSDIYSAFIYLCWRLRSQCFPLFCLMKTLAWPGKFIYRVKLSLNLKLLISLMLIEKNLFPAFLTSKLIIQARLLISTDRKKH